MAASAAYIPSVLTPEEQAERLPSCQPARGQTQKQAGSLWLIGANPGTSQIGVGGALRMDRATTMAIIDRLEGRDLVVRQRSVVDRRRHELYLTPAGQKLLVQVKKVVKDHERKFAERFTPDEQTTLISLLQRLYKD